MTHKPLIAPSLEAILKAANERFRDGKGMAVSIDPGTQGMCVYHAGENACVLGYMLPEDLARKYTMAGGVDSLIEKLSQAGILHEYQWLVVHRNVLNALQCIHDAADNWSGPWLNVKGLHAFMILCKSVGLSHLAW